MNNVHRLVVPARDETRKPPAQAVRRMGEVLILPCIRYERMDGRDGQGARRGAAHVMVQDAMRQDLTA